MKKQDILDRLVAITNGSRLDVEVAWDALGPLNRSRVIKALEGKTWEHRENVNLIPDLLFIALVGITRPDKTFLA